MTQSRDRSTMLDSNEIEAIKTCQSIINRMADNSAKVKNFFFVISAAFVALLGSSSFVFSWKAVAAYLVITCVMWYMDARYLQLEQMFRGVHNRIVNGCQPNLDSWMLRPRKEDAKSMWRLMFLNFSTVIYPILALSIGSLDCA